MVAARTAIAQPTGLRTSNGRGPTASRFSCSDLIEIRNTGGPLRRCRRREGCAIGVGQESILRQLQVCLFELGEGGRRLAVMPEMGIPQHIGRHGGAVPDFVFLQVIGSAIRAFSQWLFIGLVLRISTAFLADQVAIEQSIRRFCCSDWRVHQASGGNQFGRLVTQLRDDGTPWGNGRYRALGATAAVH